MALLLQNPSDYLVHERVGEEAPPGALEPSDWAARSRTPSPRLSGGEKQRLASRSSSATPTTRPADGGLCLDEPTRGMDRRRKDDVAALLRGLDGAVLVATHDPEFAASFAERVVLLGDGRDDRRRAGG